MAICPGLDGGGAEVGPIHWPHFLRAVWPLSRYLGIRHCSLEAVDPKARLSKVNGSNASFAADPTLLLCWHYSAHMTCGKTVAANIINSKVSLGCIDKPSYCMFDFKNLLHWSLPYKTVQS